MRAPVLTVSLIIYCIISLSFLSQINAQTGAVAGSVYIKDFGGNYRLTTEALITAANGTSTFTANYSGNQYYLLLQPGNWRITCKFSGYVSGVMDISLSEGGSVALNFYLEPSDDPNPDPEEIEPASVGGISTPINKLEILTPYIALTGLIIAVSSVIIKKRK